MKRIKNILYVVGAIVLLIIIFFRDDISERLDNIFWIFSGIWLLLIITLEIFFRRK
jgi:cell division protein FtsW (lipid II flippase)